MALVLKLWSLTVDLDRE